MKGESRYTSLHFDFWIFFQSRKNPQYHVFHWFNWWYSLCTHIPGFLPIWKKSNKMKGESRYTSLHFDFWIFSSLVKIHKIISVNDSTDDTRFYSYSWIFTKLKKNKKMKGESRYTYLHFDFWIFSSLVKIHNIMSSIDSTDDTRFLLIFLDFYQIEKKQKNDRWEQVHLSSFWFLDFFQSRKNP